MSQPRLVGTFLENRLDQMREAGIIGPEEHVQHAVVEKEASSLNSYERSDIEVATSQDNPQEHVKQSTSDAALPEVTVEQSPKLDTSQDGLSEVDSFKSISDAWPWLESHTYCVLRGHPLETLDTTEVSPTGASVPVHAPEEPQIPLTKRQPMPLTSDILPFVRTERVLNNEVIPYSPAVTAEHERIQHMAQMAREAMRSGVGFGTVTLPWIDHSTDASNSLQQQQLSMESPPQQEVASETAPTPLCSFIEKKRAIEERRQRVDMLISLYYDQQLAREILSQREEQTLDQQVQAFDQQIERIDMLATLYKDQQLAREGLSQQQEQTLDQQVQTIDLKLQTLDLQLQRLIMLMALYNHLQLAEAQQQVASEPTNIAFAVNRDGQIVQFEEELPAPRSP